MIRILLPFAAFFSLNAAHAADVAPHGDYPTNAELKAMFEADRAERKVGEIDWAKLAAGDEIRRKRARALMDAGALTAATTTITPPSFSSMARNQVTTCSPMCWQSLR